MPWAATGKTGNYWRAACWLAVPALAPFAEFHASIFALPVISPGLAALLAMAGQPADAFAPWAICAYSAWRVAWAGVGLAALHMPEPLAEMGRLTRPLRDPTGQTGPTERIDPA